MAYFLLLFFGLVAFCFIALRPQTLRLNEKPPFVQLWTTICKTHLPGCSSALLSYLLVAIVDPDRHAERFMELKGIARPLIVSLMNSRVDDQQVGFEFRVSVE